MTMLFMFYWILPILLSYDLEFLKFCSKNILWSKTFILLKHIIHPTISMLYVIICVMMGPKLAGIDPVWLTVGCALFAVTEPAPVDVCRPPS